MIAVIGLGYVGLPLAVAFGRQRPTLGFDINEARIAELNAGKDHTLEVAPADLAAASELTFSANADDLQQATIFVVTVPTPIDEAKRPNLGPLLAASRTVGAALKPGDIVIYESTVYPGCTEDACVPVLEAVSGLTYNQDFFCGYSPERINPGDKTHTLQKIMKVTSGSTPEVAQQVDALYRAIIPAGTHLAASIKVAEAAKVIENAQRDLNIAFVNELAVLFERLDIDTLDVLAAAGTKWNFLPFKPGLVGGHCIGVDPYYLAHKAESVGYHPQVILAGRRINDSIPGFVASQVVKRMIQRGHRVKDAKVLVLGITFKENCPDIRNSKVADVVRELVDYGCDVTLVDPWADPDEVRHEYGLESVTAVPEQAYAGIVLAVGHHQFVGMDFGPLRADDTVVYDVKGVLPKSEVDGRL